jgi:TRAP-type mannitol/chloroaromatic compound transport system permease large subunit
LCLVAVWRAGLDAPLPIKAAPLTGREAGIGLVSLAVLLTLLGGVAAGYLYAVEAAATGAFLLLAAGFVTGRLRGPALRAVLADAIAITGALFGLLIAATSLTLVLRLLGTDALVAAWVTGLPGGELAAVAIVLGAIGLCALVLDAFEIIFVIVPILIPPLLIRVADARWVAALLLLTLQTSFLLPPVGYALMMVRGALREPVPLSAVARALVPFLLAQWVVLGAVLICPPLAHVVENPEHRSRAPENPVSPEEVERRMREMLPPAPELPALK